MPHIKPSCLASCRAVSMASSSGHLDHLVDDVDVQHVGNEAGADALDRVPAGLELLAGPLLRDDRAVDRLDGDRS